MPNKLLNVRLSTAKDESGVDGVGQLVFQRALRWSTEAAGTLHLIVVVMGR